MPIPSELTTAKQQIDQLLLRLVESNSAQALPVLLGRAEVYWEAHPAVSDEALRQARATLEKLALKLANAESLAQSVLPLIGRAIRDAAARPSQLAPPAVPSATSAPAGAVATRLEQKPYQSPAAVRARVP